jgi:hypothetical protein
MSNLIQLPVKRDAIVLPLQAAKEKADQISQGFYKVAHKDTANQCALVLAQSYEEISLLIQQGLTALNFSTGHKKAD